MHRPKTRKPQRPSPRRLRSSCALCGLAIYLSASPVFSAPFFKSCPTPFTPFLTALPVLSAAFSVLLAAVFAPFSVSLVAALAPFSVSLAAVLVACPVFLAAIFVSLPTVLAPFSVSLVAVLAPFSVSFPAVFAASFISVPVDFLSVPASCPKTNGAAHNKAVTTSTAHLVFMGTSLVCTGLIGVCNIRTLKANVVKLASFAFALQGGEHLRVHVPLLQNAEDGPRCEPRPRQLPEDARRLFPISRLFQPLLAQVVPRLFLVADALVRRRYRLLDHRPVHAPRFQLRDHSHAPQLPIVASQRGVRRRILRVIQISLILQSPNHQFHQRLRKFGLRLLHARPHQPLQLRHGPHPPCQRSHGIFVQLFFGIGPSFGR